MKKLYSLTLFLLLTTFAFAQQGTITFYQDTVVIMNRLKVMSMHSATIGDSLVTHKPNGNTGAMHMNQLIVPYANITGTPNLSLYYLASNPSGYITSSALTPYALTSALTAGLATKFNTPVGTNLQYVRGDGVLATLPTGTTYTAGTGLNLVGTVFNNISPDQTVSLTGANGIVVTGTYPNFTISDYIPTVVSAVTRPINSTTFTVSSTKQSYVAYNVTIACTATIGSAATGSVALQYSTNSGSTWITVATVSNSNTVTLAIVLNSVQVSGLQLSGYIPANALCRMVGTSSGANTTITYLTGQETF